MKRIAFHLLKFIAVLSKMTLGRDAYMRILAAAHELHGVRFTGPPRYIHSNAMLDPSGGLTIGDGVVVSTNVVVLTHDYSYTAALAAAGRRPVRDVAFLSPVVIGDNCFLGAGVIVLPGANIGENVILGAGAVVRGEVPPNTVMAGNPAKPLCSIQEWLQRKESALGRYSLHEDAY